jgi:hypothetical protein
MGFRLLPDCSARRIRLASRLGATSPYRRERLFVARELDRRSRETLAQDIRIRIDGDGGPCASQETRKTAWLAEDDCRSGAGSETPQRWLQRPSHYRPTPTFQVHGPHHRDGIDLPQRSGAAQPSLRNTATPYHSPLQHQVDHGPQRGRVCGEGRRNQTRDPRITPAAHHQAKEAVQHPASQR